MEENAVCSDSGLNNFVDQFAATNIELTTPDIDGWFHADGPGYEYLYEQGIVDHFSVAEGNEYDEEEDADENTQHSKQKAQCSFSRAEAMQMFDHCLTSFRIQQEATVSNTSTLVRLREFAAEKRESSRKQSKIDSYFSRSGVLSESEAGNFLKYCNVELLSLFKP